MFRLLPVYFFYYHFVVLRIKQADLDIIGNNWINSFELSDRTMNSFPNEYYSVQSSRTSFVPVQMNMNVFIADYAIHLSRRLKDEFQNQ